MEGVIDTLVKATVKKHGKRYQSHKFCYDSADNGVIEYDIERKAEPLEYGETERPTKPVDLTDIMNMIRGQQPLFKYFLDGSRHTYKVDDMAFDKNVYPIIAGQVGISCCKRDEHKRLKNEFFNRRLAIALPSAALNSQWNRDSQLKTILEKINDTPRIQHMGILFDKIMTYSKDDDARYESKGIAQIQDYMIEEEKIAVMQLVDTKKLNNSSYLIKDGSLEYKAVTKEDKLSLSEPRFRSYFNYVVGVSKSFNPTKCRIKGGGSDSSVVAGLKKFERTPACRYRSEISGEGVYFCVWYMRLKDSQHTQNVFDGVIKVEKLITTKHEQEYGVETATIDMISANLIKEAFPVCYGRDSRWANHLYGVYGAETFAKSKYMSNNMFLHLF